METQKSSKFVQIEYWQSCHFKKLPTDSGYNSGPTSIIQDKINMEKSYPAPTGYSKKEMEGKKKKYIRYINDLNDFSSN